ncbi:intermembrane phospholipid transport protein YdbH family protein [Micavibrio aeruginosavorus]|uniref:intermembrane phospholipid transport protein YdbH family protein n=1 Tax=Micavibrio aeruginosavorus TaxID=349221 RepID=UPI003F4ACFE2
MMDKTPIPLILNPMKKTVLSIAALLLIVCAGLAFGGSGLLAKWRVHQALGTLGFIHAHGGQAEWTGGGIVLRDIKIDKDEFSTIEQMRISGPLAMLMPFLGGMPSITIDRATLTMDAAALLLPFRGDMKFPQQSLPALFKKNNIQAITLNSIQIDMNSPAGAIRVEAKGQATALPDGGVRLQAVVWGSQYQLTTTISANGEVAPDGTLSADFEIQDGKANMKTITASRMGGWAIVNAAPNQPATISAQLAAGQFVYHGIAMNGMTTTLDGPASSLKITMQAMLAGTKGTNITADWTGTIGKTESATIRAQVDNAADLFVALGTGLFKQNGHAIAALSDDVRQKQSRPGMIVTAKARTTAPQKTYDLSVTGLDNAEWMRGEWRHMPAMIELDIHNLDMDELTSVAGWKNTRLSGTLTGLAGIIFTPNEGLNIQDALFRTASSGTLKFSGDEFPDHLTVEDAGAKETRALMKNFDYGLMEIYIDGPGAGPMNTDITIGGRTEGNQSKPDIIQLHSDAGLLGLVGLTP